MGNVEGPAVDEVGGDAQAGIVEQAAAGAKHGPAAFAYVPGYAQARREIRIRHRPEQAVIAIEEGAGLRIQKVCAGSGNRRGVEFPAQPGSNQDTRRDLPGVLRPEREFHDLGGSADGRRTAEPEISLIGEGSDVVGDGAEDAGGIAPYGHHAAVIHAEANGVGTDFPGGGCHGLKLALAAPWPTPPMENRTSALQVLAAGNR